MMRVIPIFFAFCLVILFSCGEEEVSGCTDVNATNYDADATTDNGSCSYERDLFIGNYTITANNCNTTGFFNGLAATISPVMNNTNLVSVVIAGVYQKSLNFQGTVARGGIDIDSEVVVPGTTQADVFTYEGVGYLLPRFILRGRLTSDGGAITGTMTFAAEATADDDAGIFSFRCEFVLN